ncbi:hypothetical protein NM688_g1717 [Phlebia brevispora]|uniref:Uncharacterized protein n=1 Tax=Phlebia brevispora TaxID=194682 RepID=A0ACC1TAM9_9APHY|nr:hypothetical protein NM688_g1717 [Phlebia brevispora]
MYSKSTLLVAVAAAIGLAVATPVAEPQGPIIGSIEICTGQDLSAHCTYVSTQTGACVEFPDGFHNDIDSVSPLEGWSCTLYSDDHCTYGAYFVQGEQDTLPTSDFNSVICTPNA